MAAAAVMAVVVVVMVVDRQALKNQPNNLHIKLIILMIRDIWIVKNTKNAYPLYSEQDNIVITQECQRRKGRV